MIFLSEDKMLIILKLQFGSDINVPTKTTKKEDNKKYKYG
jgi:hypothetical protein